jgi:hypothetical protein
MDLTAFASFEKSQAFPYSAERQQQEALARTTKMSIQGFNQSSALDLSFRETFEIVEQRGTYSQTSHLFYPELPANEA